MIAQPYPAKTGSYDRSSPNDDCMRAELLSRVAKSRCATAFAALFAFYAPRIKTYLTRLGSPTDLADEITQDVMITVWRKAHLFDPGRATATTWIFRIARNRKIDKFRRALVRVVDPEDPVYQPAGVPSPESHLNMRHIRRALRSGLSKLSLSERRVVSLVYLEELSHREVASALALPLGTVKSRIRVAVEKLRLHCSDGAECLEAYDA